MAGLDVITDIPRMADLIRSLAWAAYLNLLKYDEAPSIETEMLQRSN
jgi:hypothetical protein